MNGFLKARAPLLQGGLEFGNGAMIVKPGFSPRLDPASLDEYLIDSVTFGQRTVSGAAIGVGYAGR
ncbi:MAG TPA: hypothetical protein VIM74_08525, partial [Casimicrobiaceae bacterium]|jgi:hypothetical protein